MIDDIVDAYLDQWPDSAADVVDRRNESRRWMQLNFWDQWEDIYRNSKCLTRPIMVRNRRGQEREDKTRTNVAMPETSLTIRRKTARLTANAPQINYTGGAPGVSDKLTAWSYQQYDRSGEALEHPRLVQTAATFGWAASKLWWDKITVPHKWQYRFYGQQGDVQFRDRRAVMRALRHSPAEIEDSVDAFGPDLDDQEVLYATSMLGEAFVAEQQMTQFEGPIVTVPFIGDIFMEPGCDRLSRSGWITENYWETDQWLRKMLALTYENEDGDLIRVFDPKAVRDLELQGSWSPNYGTQQPYDLRTRFRTSVLGQVVPLFPASMLRTNRYDILEEHQRGSDGRMWIEFVGNESLFLGKMPYPWELYGKSMFTELTLLPDLIQAQGDSIPGLHRFLQALHNSTVGQRKDLVNQILRPMFLKKPGFDVDEEVLERALMRFVTVRDFDSIRPLIENPIIGEAIAASHNEEAQLLRMWGLSDPSLTNTEAGTEVNPQAGKTATTAVLAAKSADALIQGELNGVGLYLKELGEKKLHMLQQVERDEAYALDGKYTSKVPALIQRYGKAVQVTLHPEELAAEFSVEPEAMSILSVDDDLRRQAAAQMAQAAAANPQVWDAYYVNRFYAGTIRGVDPDKAVPPPQPPPPPAPPETRVSISISMKWDELEPEVQQKILAKNNIVLSPETAESMQVRRNLKDLGHVSEAANHAENILGGSPPVGHPVGVNGKNGYNGPETNLSRGVPVT